MTCGRSHNQQQATFLGSPRSACWTTHLQANPHTYCKSEGETHGTSSSVLNLFRCWKAR